jgi:hypothetical protein
LELVRYPDKPNLAGEVSQNLTAKTTQRRGSGGFVPPFRLTFRHLSFTWHLDFGI